MKNLEKTPSTIQNKICTKCGEEKSLVQFSKNNKAKDRRFAHCKCCTRARDNRNGKIRKQLYDNVKKYAGCAFCGTRRPQVLTFHHVDPSRKKFEVSKERNRNLKSVLHEMCKTIVLCYNCHAEFHHSERNGTT